MHRHRRFLADRVTESTRVASIVSSLSFRGYCNTAYLMHWFAVSILLMVGMTAFSYLLFTHVQIYMEWS